MTDTKEREELIELGKAIKYFINRKHDRMVHIKYRQYPGNLSGVVGAILHTEEDLLRIYRRDLKKEVE